MKIAYLGFDLFYDCLEYLVENFNVIKIFTCDVDSAYEFNHKTYRIANDNNIPITIEPINEKAIVELEELGCDVIVSAGYYHKIPTSDKIKSVNIHPSLSL